MTLVNADRTGSSHIAMQPRQAIPKSAATAVTFFAATIHEKPRDLVGRVFVAIVLAGDANDSQRQRIFRKRT